MADNSLKEDDDAPGQEPGGEYVDMAVLTENDDKKKPDTKVVPEQKVAAEKVEKKPAKADADDDDDDDDDEKDGDSRLSAEAQDEDVDKRKERRRQEKLRRKQRARQAREAKDQQIIELSGKVETLSKQLGTVHQRVVRADLTQVAARRDQAANRVRQLDVLMKAALEAGDGTAFMDAQRTRDDAVHEWRQLHAVIEQAQARGGDDQQRRQQPQQQQRRQATAPDPLVQKLSQNFMSKHDWFDPDGNDAESVTLVAIDNAVAAEGFDPRTQSYWDEVNKRAREHDDLKHLFEAKSAKKPEARGPAMGGRGNGGGNKFYLSPARVQALKDANKWDDPVLRAKATKAYMDYDKAHPPARDAR